MIKTIKHCLFSLGFGKRMLLRCISVMIILTISVITLLGCATTTILISDGQNKYTVRTVNSDVASVVGSLKLKSEHYKIVSTAVKNNCTYVEIAYTFPVYITVGENTTQIFTSPATVGEVLGLAGFEVDEHDFVQPDINTFINDTVYIDYTDIEYVSGSYTEAIPYTVETVYSNKHNKGTQTVENGCEGLLQVNYTEKLINGIPVEKSIVQTSVIAEPVNSKQIIGTKTAPVAKVESKPVITSASVNCISTLAPASPIELDERGNPVKYKSKITARATAYTYTGKNCSTGVAPQPGYIAVNPNIIPYGTKMYIKTADGGIIYGYAVAADTGGFVAKHPNGVDLFMTTKSACVSFGVRNVEIYILE